MAEELSESERREYEAWKKQKELEEKYEAQRGFLDSMLDKANSAKKYIYDNRNRDVQIKRVQEEAKKNRANR